MAFFVGYDGTAYHGFERQPTRPTIQGELEKVFQDLMGPGRIIGASRTDAGVHAEGQLAVWRGAVPIPWARVAGVVNRRLPPDIRVREVWRVDPHWDPRREASIKQYSYRVWPGAEEPPWQWGRWVWWCPQPLSWQTLQEAAAQVRGTHDFYAFRSEGSSAHTTVRTLYHSSWHLDEGGRIWRYQVIGDGFLYHMVRHLVGSMVKAASVGGDVSPITRGLQHPDHKVRALAPARGLTLDWIHVRNGGNPGVS